MEKLLLYNKHCASLRKEIEDKLNHPLVLFKEELLRTIVGANLLASIS